MENTSFIVVVMDHVKSFLVWMEMREKIIGSYHKDVRLRGTNFSSKISILEHLTRVDERYSSCSYITTMGCKVIACMPIQRQLISRIALLYLPLDLPLSRSKTSRCIQNLLIKMFTWVRDVMVLDGGCEFRV